jgi:hypothetical protein
MLPCPQKANQRGRMRKWIRKEGKSRRKNNKRAPMHLGRWKGLHTAVWGQITAWREPPVIASLPPRGFSITIMLQFQVVLVLVRRQTGPEAIAVYS